MIIVTADKVRLEPRFRSPSQLPVASANKGF